jgi:hypothetical protein
VTIPFWLLWLACGVVSAIVASLMTDVDRGEIDLGLVGVAFLAGPCFLVLAAAGVAIAVAWGTYEWLKARRYWRGRK